MSEKMKMNRFVVGWSTVPKKNCQEAVYGKHGENNFNYVDTFASLSFARREAKRLLSGRRLRRTIFKLVPVEIISNEL
jgi:hypothetical protein